jgi:nucleotide-binding universal stress UspA family protein
MKRVLIAVDDSVESLAAARCGAALAAGWGANVLVVTAIDGAAERAPEGARERSQRLAEHVARDVRAAGNPPQNVDVAVREGEAFRCILEAAEQWRANLIVMGVSRRVALRSPYVGSQTEHVLEFAECPVLVVPSVAPQGVRA